MSCSLGTSHRKVIKSMISSAPLLKYYVCRGQWNHFPIWSLRVWVGSNSAPRWTASCICITFVELCWTSVCTNRKRMLGRCICLHVSHGSELTAVTVSDSDQRTRWVLFSWLLASGVNCSLVFCNVWFSLFVQYCKCLPVWRLSIATNLPKS